MTASAPRMVMVQVSPLTHPPSTAPPPEPEELPGDPPRQLDCDDPSGGRRRISSTSSHRRLSQIVCGEGDPAITYAVAGAIIAVLFASLMALVVYRKQRGMQRNAQPRPQQPAAIVLGVALQAIVVVGDAAGGVSELGSSAALPPGWD